MVTLFYAVVGEVKTCSVTVNDEDTIDIIQNAIALELEFSSPRELTLYHTKRSSANGGRWLARTGADLEALQVTPVPDVMKQKYLSEAGRLDSADSVRTCFAVPAREAEIHVLVVLPTTSKRPSGTHLSLLEQCPRLQPFTIDWVRAPVDCPKLDFNPNVPWIRIPKHYFANTGVYAPKFDDHVTLYIRKAVTDQWGAMQTKSVELPSRLWIIGTPGVGKSCAAFAFACGWVDRRKWDVLWMHYDDSNRVVECVKLVREKKWMCMFPPWKAHDLLPTLIAPWSLPSSRPLIVFFRWLSQAQSRV